MIIGTASLPGQTEIWRTVVTITETNALVIHTYGTEKGNLIYRIGYGATFQITVYMFTFHGRNHLIELLVFIQIRYGVIQSVLKHLHRFVLQGC